MEKSSQTVSHHGSPLETRSTITVTFIRYALPVESETTRGLVGAIPLLIDDGHARERPTPPPKTMKGYIPVRQYVHHANIAMTAHTDETPQIHTEVSV